MAKPITPKEMRVWIKETWNKCQEEAWQEQKREDVWQKSMENALVYGTGFVRFDSMGGISVVDPKDYQYLEKKEWVGYTNEDRERIVPVLVQSLLNHDEKTMAGLLKAILIDIEAQLKEKNT